MYRGLASIIGAVLGLSLPTAVYFCLQEIIGEGFSLEGVQGSEMME